MTVKINDDLKSAIETVVRKNYSWKEKVYDLIDKLEKEQEYTSDDFVKNYAKDAKTPVYSLLSTHDAQLVKDYFVKQITQSLSNLFKNVKNTDFISVPDKQLFNKYAECLKFNMVKDKYYDCNLNTLSIKLSSKLGKDTFDVWVKEYNQDKLTIELSKVINDAVNKFDTHRYSEEAVQCFLKASIADDSGEATSECQYALHNVVLGGEHSLSADHGEL